MAAPEGRPAKAEAAPEGPSDQAREGHSAEAGGRRVLFASPVARRSAEMRGVALGSLTGRDPMGAVVPRDVEPAAAGPGTPPLAPGRGGKEIGVHILQAGQGSPVILFHGFGADLSSPRRMPGQFGIGSRIMARDPPGRV